jgi:hypothetical protein
MHTFGITRLSYAKIFLHGMCVNINLHEVILTMVMSFKKL